MQAQSQRQQGRQHSPCRLPFSGWFASDLLRPVFRRSGPLFQGTSGPSWLVLAGLVIIAQSPPTGDALCLNQSGVWPYFLFFAYVWPHEVS